MSWAWGPPWEGAHPTCDTNDNPETLGFSLTGARTLSDAEVLPAIPPRAEAGPAAMSKPLRAVVHRIPSGREVAYLKRPAVGS